MVKIMLFNLSETCHFGDSVRDTLSEIKLHNSNVTLVSDVRKLHQTMDTVATQ